MVPAVARAFVLVLLASTGAFADPPAADPRGVRGPAMSALAAGELGRSTHVALGTIARVREVRGLMVAHVNVERWLMGTEPAAEVTVMVGGPRATRDPRAPSAPFFDRRTGVSYVLFLARRSDGEAFQLENRQPIEGLEGLERLRAVEAQIAVARVVDPDERALAALEMGLQGLAARGAWSRSHAARELNFLVGVRSDVFDGRARARIAAAAEAATAPTLKAWLEALAKRLDGLPLALGPAPVAERPPPPLTPLLLPPAVPATETEPAATEDGEALLARLDAALAAAGPEAPTRAAHLLKRLATPMQRVAVVDWLAAAGHADALPVLREHYAREDDVGVREAVVRAHGLLGGAADVGWLAERLTNARLVEAALLALARVRTPVAVGALRAFADRRRQGTEEERDLAERVDHLLSPAFEAADAEARRPR